MTYYKLAKLRWGEISCTLGNFKATFSVHIWVIRNVQLSCSVTHQRKAQSFWAVRWATLPLRHTCLFSKSKWNTSWNVSLQPWCSQFPTRREKMYSPQRRYSCHCHPSPLAQLSTTLKTKGDPRERQQKKPLFIDSAISFVQSIFLLLSRFISYAPMMYGRASMFTSLFRWGKTGPICKNRHFNWLGEVTGIISCG